MTIHIYLSAQQAIDRSISHDEIVHVADLNTISHDLMQECEDYTDAGEKITEYWGTDESGQDWRVHAHRA
jgi:hypothetical protein